MIFALALLPLALAVGCVVDFARASQARTLLQAAADSAALAAAKARSDDVSEMRRVAELYVKTNLASSPEIQAYISDFKYKSDDRDISLTISGHIATTFMQVGRIASLDIGAKASSTRALPGTTEVALVLDNTWSMNGAKLTALKKAADDMVVTLKKDPKNSVKIALVPYADYVNVGVTNRAKSWLNVPADYTKVNKGSCWKVTQSCVRGIPKTCTRYVDGQAESYDCTPSICVPIVPYETCSKDSTQNFRWFGCVGSRTTGNLYLNDDQPSVPYPGLLSTSQACLNPIIPLTDSQIIIRTAIASMIVNIGSYKPSTYIPAGLVWGLNVLSPTEPFSEGRAYDPYNKNPNKALVLMTDGANTMKLVKTNGTHEATTNATELTQTYKDMLAICDNIKQRKISVYTVSFNVDDQQSRDAMLKCATSSDYAFDAKDEKALSDAFKQIASSLENIRLTR